MIKNYFKIAWRSLWKHKAYSLINIIGLSVGLTACLVVATIVADELSYDRQWKKGDDIYRVISTSNSVKGTQPMPLAISGFGPSIKKDLPEVTDYCRMSVGKQRLQFGDNKEGIAFKRINAEASIWNFLDFKILRGNPQKYVKGYTNIIITKKMEDEYFPGQNPVGKTVLALSEFSKPEPYLITGVINAIPQNTHLRADYITISEYTTDQNSLPKPGSGYTFLPQYVLLKPGTDIKSFTLKANNWYMAQSNSKVANYSFSFQPIKDVYLKSDFNQAQQIHGSITNVYIFSGVAILLLLIACINFINLTISRVFSRSKETGIRKVLGAERGQIIIRFLSESVIFFTLSFIIAFLFYPVILKPVEAFMDHQLVLNLYDQSFLIIAVFTIFLVSLLTGLYPAWYLSRPKPIHVIRNSLSSTVQLNILKKGLVLGQFVISTAIIMVAFIVHNQMNFINKKDLGYDKTGLVNLSFTNWENSGNAFKQAVKQIPGVANASISDWAPAEGSGTMSKEVSVPGQKDKVNLYFIEGDADLINVLGLKLKSGRLIDQNLTSDAISQDSSMYGNSAATKAAIKVQPIVATSYTTSLLGLKTNQLMADVDGMPVGIVKDFNSESLHDKLQPTFIMAVTDIKYGNMLIKIKPGYEKRALLAINTLYKNFYPNKPFKYDWVSDQVNDMYKSEYKLQQLFTCFSMLIIFLACLGLLGLVSFTAEQRVKEIGIRKVLGASVTNILILISRDYLWLVISAIFIASPIAWYAMSKWLESFAYRIQIQWWVFALTGVLAVIIAFVTISFQSVKAALANPVKSLRSE